MIFTSIVIVFLLVYMCVGITFVARLVYRQVIGTKKANKTVTVIRDIQATDGLGNTANLSSRVIPLTDEYEYDQSTKFKNLSNR
jgi:hypothetical protein